jgi:hypothetical protein
MVGSMSRSNHPASKRSRKAGRFPNFHIQSSECRDLPVSSSKISQMTKTGTLTGNGEIDTNTVFLEKIILRFDMKTLRTLLALAAFSPLSAFASAGMYDQFVFLSTNSGPLAFYDAGASTANPNFQGASLGTFNRFVDTLQIGGQQKSFKNGGTDVLSHSVFWRILELGGAFTGVTMPFQWNFGDAGAPGNLNNPGDQQWGGDTQGANGNPIEISTNVFSSLLNGAYTLEVYTQITTNGTGAPATIFNNNGGANYQATFTLIPEPSRAMLLGLGLTGLIFRRRR